VELLWLKSISVLDSRYQPAGITEERQGCCEEWPHQVGLVRLFVALRESLSGLAVVYIEDTVSPLDALSGKDSGSRHR